MSKDDPTPSSLWLFVIKFCIGIVVLVGIWWELVLPTYGWMLGKVTGLIASTLLGVPVDGVVVKVDGLFNTHTMLEFAVGERRPAMPIAQLVTNIPPYIALVLATAGIALGKRLRILAYGCGILIVGHVLFLCTLLRFQESLLAHPQIPVAIIQLFLTLPFLLWIVFAYWDRISALLRESAEEGKK
jgi:hypothetical protein